MRDDLNQLVQRIQTLPDSELVALLEQKRGQYTREAISIAEEEAEERGGLAYLKQEAARTSIEKRRPRRRKRAMPGLDTVLSKLIGGPPSEKYPALSYVAIALRLISFVLAVVALVLCVTSLVQLVAGSGGFWLPSFLGSLQIGVAFLFFGGSELINVLIDIEKNTRVGRRLNDEHETEG